MKPINTATRQKKIISFSILVFITGAVVFLLLSSLWQNNVKAAKITDTKTTTVTSSQDDKLVQYDEQLHARLLVLQQLDEQYVSLLVNSANMKSLDSFNTVIHQQEEYFNAAVNRISQNVVVFTDENKRKQFLKMITSFRAAIDNRTVINRLRNEVALKNENPGADKDIQLPD